MTSTASNAKEGLADLQGVVLDGRYEIGAPLSEGGMGMVYRGQQLALRRPVAIKLVKPGLNDREQHVRRLVREAQTTAMVKHPNVVEIIDVGVMQHGFVYLVMELLEGVDLRTHLREHRRLPWPRAQAIALQVVSALKAAHARGVIHRDIKPSNVFLVDQAPGVEGDFVKVLDFGLAKCGAGGRTPTLTGAAEVVGTATYLAPEVARGRKADFRSEVYAVGVLMYKMVTGTVPFKGSNPLDVLAKAISNPVPAPRTRTPELPREADRIIRRCLAKRPDLRPQDMDALEHDLHALGAPGASERSVTVTPSTPRAEQTQVAPPPLEPPPSAPKVDVRSPLRPSSNDEDPSDVLEAAISEVLELDVGDVDVVDSGGSGFLEAVRREEERARRQPALRVVPDPEPSGSADVVQSSVALGPVVQSQTAVSPGPPRPPREFAADLPRDDRGFAPALDTDVPTLPVDYNEPAVPPSTSPVPAGRVRFVALMLAVPAIAAVVGFGLWAVGVFERPTPRSAVAMASLSAATEVRPVSAAITWSDDFRATPVPPVPQVMAPSYFTPPKLRRPEPGDPMPVATTDPVPVATGESATPSPTRTRTKKKRRRPARRPNTVSSPTRRPPPKPPTVPTKKKKKRPTTDASAPWKRVPVPSDNW